MWPDLVCPSLSWVDMVMGSAHPHQQSANRLVSMMILENETFLTFPPSRIWMDIPRLLSLMMQLSTTTFSKSPVPSVPIFKAAEVDVRVHPEIITFLRGPYSILPEELFRQIQSSAHVTWQPIIRTLVE